MKKLNNWALVLIMILTAGFTLTSCDEDNMQASDLHGQWRGDFGMYYTDHYNYEWKASYTILEFFQTGFTSHGTGKQYDYYNRGPYKYQYFRFNWEIRNGVIFLTYPGDHNLDTEIHDYQMSSRYFSGYFGNSRTPFNLDKYYDWRWDDYNRYNDYGYYYNSGYTYGGYYYDDYYYDYYYAKTRSGEETKVPLVKNGNYFNEGRTPNNE